MTRIIVLGREGQLAKSLAHRAGTQAGVDLLHLGRPELDLETPYKIAQQIRHFRVKSSREFLGAWTYQPLSRS